MTHFRIGLFYTSDVHSHVYPHRYADMQPEPYGIARAAAYIERQRAAYDASLFIDNGDLIQGAPISYYDAKIADQPSYPAVAALNQLGCDAAVIGNHEFNYGSTYLSGAVGQSRFPWLAANIVDAASDQPRFGPPYLVREVAPGLRVAILGLTTKYIPNWEHPQHIAGLRFDDPVATAARWVPHLRAVERASVVIVAYHGGLECDLETGEPLEACTGENQGCELLTKVSGIDVLLTGHQHRDVIGHSGKTVVLQPGCEGRSVGLVELDCANLDGEWTVESLRGRLLATADFAPHSAVLEAPAIARCERHTQQWLDQPMGRVDGDLRIHDAWLARQVEHPFVEFINRVQMWASGASISAAALFEEDATGFPSQITMRDIISNYKYPNTLQVLRVSGRVIRAALERSATYFAVDDEGRPAVSQAFLFPKPQHFNYDMWQGIEYELNVCQPPGNRVQQLRHEGRDIRDSDVFEVVMNNYRASGGGNYDMFRGCKVVRDIPVDVSELIANYIREHTVVEATCDHNWRVIGPSSS